jgi:hypothetical protein
MMESCYILIWLIEKGHSSLNDRNNQGNASKSAALPHIPSFIVFAKQISYNSIRLSIIECSAPLNKSTSLLNRETLFSFHFPNSKKKSFLSKPVQKSINVRQLPH